MIAGTHLVILLLTWAVALAVVGFALYWVVRLAVLHALKAHTEWQRAEQASRRGTDLA
ncbi:hypothetical protein [Microbacterium sp. NPDC096154]|uniref:hypothetical protein n=1 Tax=Microbacterium sp. NPDC096154 TaxID=3155549 RepID=UPI00332A1071